MKRRERNCLLILVSLCSCLIIMLIWKVYYNLSAEPLRKFPYKDNYAPLTSPNVAQRYNSTADIVYLVSSAPDNFLERAAIRKTWGREARVRPVFFMGRSVIVNERNIYTESALHGDVVLDDFVDSNRNHTVKMMFMMRWVLSMYCNNEKVMFLRDSTFVQPEKIQTFVDKEIRFDLNANLVGRKYVLTTITNPFTMHTVDTYYLSGSSGYIMTLSQIALMFQTALNIPFIAQTDVFLTGLIAGRTLGYGLANDDRFSRTKPFFNTEPCLYKDLFTAPYVTPYQLTKVWGHLQDLNITVDCNSFWVFLKNIMLSFRFDV